MMNNTNVMTQQISDAVMANEAFLKALVAAENAASAQQVLKDNGFDLSVEEVEALYRDGAQNICAHLDNGELAEDQLDDVAGGGFFRGTLRLAVSGAAAFGYGMLCGVCPAASAGAPYVAGGLSIWTAAGYKKKGW